MVWFSQCIYTLVDASLRGGNYIHLINVGNRMVTHIKSYPALYLVRPLSSLYWAFWLAVALQKLTHQSFCLYWKYWGLNSRTFYVQSFWPTTELLGVIVLNPVVKTTGSKTSKKGTVFSQTGDCSLQNVLLLISIPEAWLAVTPIYILKNNNKSFENY